jgi:hypothetical protein
MQHTFINTLKKPLRKKVKIPKQPRNLHKKHVEILRKAIKQQHTISDTILPTITTRQIMLYQFISTHFFVAATLRKVASKRLTVLLGLSLLITACANIDTDTPVAEKNTPDIFHQDSTVYFSDKKSSVSLRASFIQKTSAPSDTTTSIVTTQSLMNGYKLQFRSILKGNNAVEKISIIAGGKRIILSDTSLFIQTNKGLTINTNKEDTRFIMEQSDATLRFKFNQKSYLMSIRNHTLSEFIVPL